MEKESIQKKENITVLLQCCLT